MRGLIKITPDLEILSVDPEKSYPVYLEGDINKFQGYARVLRDHEYVMIEADLQGPMFALIHEEDLKWHAGVMVKYSCYCPKCIETTKPLSQVLVNLHISSFINKSSE